MVRYLKGESVKNKEVIEWVREVVGGLESFVSKLEDMSHVLFTHRVCPYALTVLKFRCGEGIEHGVSTSDDLVDSFIGRMTYGDLCKYLNSYVIPAKIYLYEEVPKRYHLTITAPIEEVSVEGETRTERVRVFGKMALFVEEYGGLEVTRNGVEVWLLYHGRPYTEYLGHYSPAVGVTWGEFAEELGREYEERFGVNAVLKNPEEFIMGMAEMMELYVKGLTDIASNFNKYVAMLQLYP